MPCIKCKKHNRAALLIYSGWICRCSLWPSNAMICFKFFLYFLILNYLGNWSYCCWLKDIPWNMWTTYQTIPVFILWQCSLYIGYIFHESSTCSMTRLSLVRELCYLENILFLIWFCFSIINRDLNYPISYSWSRRIC